MNGASSADRARLNDKYRLLAPAPTLIPTSSAASSADETAGQEAYYPLSAFSAGDGGVDEDGWPLLDTAAYHSLAGEVVSSVDPHTEADKAGVLLSFLAAFGNACGSEARAIAGDAPHPAKLNVLLVGQSSRARKGTAGAVVKAIMSIASPEWAKGRVLSGLSSGEGLLAPVDDSEVDLEIEGIKSTTPKNPDKRLMIVESEFGRTLTVMSREQNTLASIIREAWDGPDQAILNRGTPLTATGTHISIVGHITRDELLQKMSNVDMANGFANRFLFALIRQSKKLPRGGNVPSTIRNHLATRVRRALDDARLVGRVRLPGREPGEMGRTEAAEELWEQVYERIDVGPNGILGAVTARPEAQLLRLSVAYALLDGAAEIDVPHIRAALAVWNYCEASARYVFGDQVDDDPLVVALRDTLKRAGEQGMTGTELNKAFGGRKNAAAFAEARAVLERAGHVKVVSEATGGAPRRHYYYIGPAD